MRRLGMAVAVVLVLMCGPAAVAQELISVDGGPASPTFFVPRCNDIAIPLDQQTSFVLRRTGSTATPLTVTYTLSGTAQPGVHYQPLPGTVTFPAGADSVTVEVIPLPTPLGTLVDLTMTVAGDSATIRFVSPPPPEPVECGYFFTSDEWNRSQSVAAGQPLHRLTLEEVRPPAVLPAMGRFRLVSGTLPPGVTLNEDGSFTGTPLVPGTYTARIEACRPAPPGTCISTDLTVTVQGGFTDVISAFVATVRQQVTVLLRQIFAGFGFG